MNKMIKDSSGQLVRMRAGKLPLDDIGEKLLSMVGKRMSIPNMCKDVSLSLNAVHNRLKKMEQLGLIHIEAKKIKGRTITKKGQRYKKVYESKVTKNSEK